MILLAAIFAPPSPAGIRPRSTNRDFAGALRRALVRDRQDRLCDVRPRPLWRRISILSASAALLISAAIGVIIGCYCGLCRRSPDIARHAGLGSHHGLPRDHPRPHVGDHCRPASLPNLMAIFIVGGWCGIYRLVRAQMLSIREKKVCPGAAQLRPQPRLIASSTCLLNALGPVMVNITSLDRRLHPSGSWPQFLSVSACCSACPPGATSSTRRRTSTCLPEQLVAVAAGRPVHLALRVEREFHRRRFCATPQTQRSIEPCPTSHQRPQPQDVLYAGRRCNKAVNGVSFDIRRGKTLCASSAKAAAVRASPPPPSCNCTTLSRIEDGEIIYHSDHGDIRPTGSSVTDGRCGRSAGPRSA